MVESEAHFIEKIIREELNSSAGRDGRALPRSISPGVRRASERIAALLSKTKEHSDE